MNENLDLIKILKDCPKGTKLWSSVFGDCEFSTIDFTGIIYPIKCQITTKDRRTTYVGFTKNGRLDIQYENAGCVLFPSEENMDWSTFRITKEHKCFEPFHKNMDKTINNNGFDYVDLGLPSGTKWATMNVGASKPSDFGLNFQWGSDSNFSKYNTSGDTLDLEDDAANIHMGGDWHMPTPTQILELINETDNTWTTQDGINGRLFTSKNNGKSIFIPAAGYAWNGLLYDVGSTGYVWSSVLSSSNVYYGQYLSFYSEGAYLNHGDRGDRLSVRGVLG